MSTPTTNAQTNRSNPVPDQRVEGIEAVRAGLTLTPPPETGARAGALRERLVTVMIAVASAALGGILYLQGGYAAPVAAGGAVGALAAGLIINALAGRSVELRRVRSEIARLEMELARAKAAAQVPGGRPGEANFDPRMPSGLPPEIRYEAGGARRSRMVPAGSAALVPGTPAAGAPAPGAPAPGTPLPLKGGPRSSDDALAGAEAQRRKSASDAAAYAAPERSASLPSAEPSRIEDGDLPAWAAPTEAQGEALREDWEATTQADARARDQGIAQTEKPAMRTAAPPAPAPAATAPPPSPTAARSQPPQTIESDLELVQRKIKALAEEVNASEAARAALRTDLPPSAPTDIDGSIAALRSAADRMRPARKDFAARRVYSEPVPPAAPVRAAPAPANIPPARVTPQSASSSIGAPFGSSSSAQVPASATPIAGPGVLPSLDALIPASAQPIAVSMPNAPTSPPSADVGSDAAAAAYRDYGRTGDGIGVDTSRTPSPRREMAGPGAYDDDEDVTPPVPAPRNSRSTAMPSAAPRQDEWRDAAAPTAPPSQPVPAPAMSPISSPASLGAAPAPVAVSAMPPLSATAAAAATPEPSEHQPARNRRAAPDRRLYDRRFVEIATAIEQRTMDVFLNPIVGLGDYAVTHFEVDVRLRTEAGSYIDDPVSTLKLHPTDFVAMFDIERLERSARVGEQLEQRGKTGSLLSPTSGHSMTDGKFLEAFALTFESRNTISGQLVLTFTQADLEAFSPGAWQAISDMHSFGFRFAVEQITHLGMDFGQLAARGFAFVKLPAEAFLDGLPAGQTMVPPADICRHLAGAGLTLVVEAIDDDQMLARVFGFGALFGQGTLFGGSRQITLEALGPKRAA